MAWKPSRNRFDPWRLLGRLPALVPERGKSEGRSVPAFSEPVSRVVERAAGRAPGNAAGAPVPGRAVILDPCPPPGWNRALPGRRSDHRELAVVDAGVEPAVIAGSEALTRGVDPALRSGRGSG